MYGGNWRSDRNGMVDNFGNDTITIVEVTV
jgi:hypothetical protein